MVLPISVDSVPTLREFKAKERISVELLSDFKREVSRRYGTLLEEQVLLQPGLRSDRSERHRTLDLRRGHAQHPAGEQRAARADSRACSSMRGSQLALLAVLLAASACRIEDHTPTGTRRDEEAVQALVARYARTLQRPRLGRARAAVLAGRELLGADDPALGRAGGADRFRAGGDRPGGRRGAIPPASTSGSCGPTSARTATSPRCGSPCAAGWRCPAGSGLERPRLGRAPRAPADRRTSGAS